MKYALYQMTFRRNETMRITSAYYSLPIKNSLVKVTLPVFRHRSTHWLGRPVTIGLLCSLFKERINYLSLTNGYLDNKLT